MALIDAAKTAFGGLMYGLDTPGALLRGGLANLGDLMSGEDRFQGYRARGRQMLESFGMGENRPGLDMGDVAGFAADVAVDPLNLIPGFVLAKALHAPAKLGKAAMGLGKAAKAVDTATDVAKVTRAAAVPTADAIQFANRVNRARAGVTAASIASPIAGMSLMEQTEGKSPIANAIAMGLMTAPLVVGGVAGIKKLKGMKKAPTSAATPEPIKMSAKTMDAEKASVNWDSLPDAMDSVSLTEGQRILWNELKPVLSSQTKGMPRLLTGDLSEIEVPRNHYAAGKYDSLSHTIRVDPAAARGQEGVTLLHEAVHAATRDAVLQFEAPFYHGNRAANVPSESVQSYYRIRDILDGVRKDITPGAMKSLDDAGAGLLLDNPAELIAYGFTDPKAREVLSAIKVPGSSKTRKLQGSNLFQVFIDFVADLLGIKSKRSMSALEEIILLGGNIASGDIANVSKLSTLKTTGNAGSLAPWIGAGVGFGAYKASRMAQEPEA